jgi:glycosyltransferase involved in cell wall biosynthesis
MLLNKIYYACKPYMPWGLRMFLRRQRANHRRHAFANTWPIDQRAGTTPPGWPGWPDGKRFAMVLTHDVEGNKGLTRVGQLMDLEEKHSFRSSFNLVPEQEYRVSSELRQSISDRGFEVGIHGLEHDGKLYSSKAAFASKAARIRKYLSDWEAVGFRSPLMQHRLGWLHELGVEYDASTFDTDPFEPEPHGVGTIFPFWVSGPDDSGYVELPYTLVQDFTLFVVLGERNIDIWKQKLDWVAEHGGMALLNTHPDYMCFEGKCARDEFPVAHYAEFLRYAREKYEGQFWSAQPRDVARHYCESIPQAARNSRRKICMVAYTNYESDNRVRRYAEALVKRGDRVDVIAVSMNDYPLGTEEVKGVAVHRIQRRRRNEQHKWAYAWRLLRFTVAASIFLRRRQMCVGYDLIHVHNVPDFLVFSAWYPKLVGAKVILDIHDIVPELFASKFAAGKDTLSSRLLKHVERASATFADHVVAPNHLWYKTLISRSVPETKCSVFLNHVDPNVFHTRARTRTDGKLVILFPGTYQWHQGLDIAIEAFARVRTTVPHAEFHLYGAGPEEANLRGLSKRLGLNGSVSFFPVVSLDRVADVIANADLGVVPKRADSFGNEAYSTKIMEFMSQGVPVVVSRTKIDSFYFDDQVVRFFTSGDSDAMAEAMLGVIGDSTLRKSLVAAGHDYVGRNNWAVAKNGYFELVDTLSTERF